MRQLFGGLALAIGLLAAGPPAIAQPGSPLVVTNIADDFLRFWDATKDLSTPERVVLFKRNVASQFPAFYDIKRFGGGMTQDMQDRKIARAIESFGPIRDAYAAKLVQFDGDQARATASFIDAFPDFRPETPVYVVHSLGEMDGGTRTLDGKTVLVFGIDGMVRYHGKDWKSEAQFFHHELFHVYHEPRLGQCDEMWCALWEEGLAVYVSSVLNPDADDAELLLDFPAGTVATTRAALIPALESLKDQLTAKDDNIYAELFQTQAKGPTTLPVRRGYYLGYLVAKELGRTRDLKTLANLPQPEAKALVAATVQKLLDEARASARQSPSSPVQETVRPSS